VLVWTAKELSDAELKRLRKSAQDVVSKNGDGAGSLLRELQAFLTESQPAGVK
jgi:hypothetical protein